MPAPTIFNLTLTDADTEYSQALPGKCKKISIQCRTSSDMRIAWVTGKVATPTAPYGTIKGDSVFFETAEPPEDSFDGETVYLASSDAAVVAEILCWN